MEEETESGDEADVGQVEGDSEDRETTPPTATAQFGFTDENQSWLKPAKKSAKLATKKKRQEQAKGKLSLLGGSDGGSDPEMGEWCPVAHVDSLLGHQAKPLSDM